MPRSATPDPVDVIRLNVDALNRRDFAAVVATFTEGGVWDTPDLGVVQGREGIRALFEEWLAAYEELEHELVEVRDLGSGVTFSEERQRARLPGSSHFVENHYAAVTEWKDGLAERVVTYQDISEGRAAAERLAGERRSVVPGAEFQRSAAEARLRAWFDGFNETQEPQLSAVHPEIEWHLRADLPDSRALIGHEGVRQLNADWSEVFEDLCLEPVDVIDVGSKTVATIRFHARHKPTGHALDMEEAWVIGWRNLQIIEIREYNTREQALGSLGLGE